MTKNGLICINLSAFRITKKKEIIPLSVWIEDSLKNLDQMQHKPTVLVHSYWDKGTKPFLSLKSTKKEIRFLQSMIKY